MHRHAKGAELLHRRFVRNFTGMASVTRTTVGVLSVIASFFCLIELTLYFGFERNAEEADALKQLFRIPQAIFIIDGFPFSRKYCTATPTYSPC